MAYLFSDLQSPLAQRLCLLVLPPLSIEHSQVIQGCSNLDRQRENSVKATSLLWFAFALEVQLYTIRT